ncbi:P-loop containing nucleoside triphosphate hydrolase protein [Hypomontagnella monticulosa]|nr:P-loop containing nucleoside triphosphate hydrolase protein [Hypomontagnella monticulosa]
MTESMIWTDEEIRYLKALLSWRPSEDGDDVDEKSCLAERPAGQFMFLVLGAKGCGKTSILEKFCHGTTVEEGSPDSDEQERAYCHKMDINEETYVLNALELPHQHVSGDDQLKQAVQITEAAVLVYDIRSRTSFISAQEIYSRIEDMVQDNRLYGLALVGTNSDCEDEQRGVPWAEGRKLAESFKLGCMFLETSANTGENIDKLFPQLGDEVLKLRWLNYQRRAQTEKFSIDEQQRSIDDSSTKRVAKWKTWTRHWFQRGD